MVHLSGVHYILSLCQLYSCLNTRSLETPILLESAVEMCIWDNLFEQRDAWITAATSREHEMQEKTPRNVFIGLAK